jgi:hypothetical protein
MRERMKHPGLIAFVAVGLVLAGGIAFATIPDPNGVIHACYTKSTGELRVIDASVTNCTKKQTSLNWNVQGPQGPPGIEGRPGTPGIQGPPGPSHGYENSATNVAVAQDPARSKVVQINNLPAGNYMIWASVTFEDALNEPDVACRLDVDGTEIPNSVSQIELKSGLGDMSLVSAATLTGSGSTVEVLCNASDNSVSVTPVTLSLVMVDSLN